MNLTTRFTVSNMVDASAVIMHRPIAAVLSAISTIGARRGGPQMLACIHEKGIAHHVSMAFQTEQTPDEQAKQARTTLHDSVHMANDLKAGEQMLVHCSKGIYRSTTLLTLMLTELKGGADHIDAALKDTYAIHNFGQPNEFKERFKTWYGNKNDMIGSAINDYCGALKVIRAFDQVRDITDAQTQDGLAAQLETYAPLAKRFGMPVLTLNARAA